GQFNPVQYLMPLAKLIHDEGSYIFEETHVTRVHHDVPIRVEAGGFVVTADHVVYATHQPIHDKLFVAKLAAYQTYALGLKVPSGTFPQALAWDTLEPYHYWRQVPGAGHDLLIIGGEDHRTGQDDDTEARYRALEDYAAHSLGKVAFEVAYRWSGQVLSPMDGAPFIGRLAAIPNAYVATGYNGNGMTLGTFAGLLISDLILDRENALATLVDPNRFRIAAGGVTFLQENLGFPRYMVGDRLRPDACEAIAAIAPGEGCLVDLEGEMVAASKDEHGKVTALSATCTHMGCLVHWNGAEKSWDCPCHGSRFATNGQVMCGPAREGLPPARATLKVPEQAPGS
ncbi:MAG: (2Fe-2S)-binding protein, partial [Cyanobacteria bacterium RYN_339]|nr:(2Fe-2S)-binding protein [Cyanobacteria bacterium RYN_339]